MIIVIIGVHSIIGVSIDITVVMIIIVSIGAVLNVMDIIDANVTIDICLILGIHLDEWWNCYLYWRNRNLWNCVGICVGSVRRYGLWYYQRHWCRY
jgi:hypothetical protein